MALLSLKELKLLWPFYLEAFLSALLFFAPAFYVIYFVQLGFTYWQIGILMAVVPLASLIFEIPTGAVADIYGRKISVILSYTLLGLAFVSCFFLTTYIQFLILFAFIGFAFTFYSGAGEAWVTDYLNKKGKKFLEHYFAKTLSISSLGLIFSGIIGAFLVKYFGLEIIWPSAGISFIIAAVILSFGKEIYNPRKSRIKQSWNLLVKQTKTSIHYSATHPTLTFLLLGSFIFAFALGVSELMTWTPLLLEYGLPDYAFAYLWSASAAVTVIAPLISGRMARRFGKKGFTIISAVLVMLATLAIVGAYSLTALLFLFLVGVFFNYMWYPTERLYFHSLVPSRLRATVGSVEGMLGSIAEILALPLAGYLMTVIGPRATIFVSGLLLIPSIVLYSLMKK